MAASPKEKFDAAIKVIHSLPKDGPFQPSREMMLTFYGYFKQATEGKCTMPKPSFWDLVKKAKWEAWSKLGDMAQEDAMNKYVDELKKTLKMCAEKWNEMAKNDDPRIVEAMPQTQAVGDFMEKLGTFYELIDEESPIPGAVMPNGRPAMAQFNNGDEYDEMNISQQVEASLKKLTHLGNETDQIRAALAGLSENEPHDRGDSALRQFSHFDEEEDEEEDDTEGNEDEEEEEMDAVTPHSEYSQSNKPPLTNGTGHQEDGMTDTSENRSSSLDSTVLHSSDSEEEFCDTSDNPAEVQEVVLARRTQQVSTPLKAGAKQNRVHFADNNNSNMPNGRISPIEQNTEHLSMAPGFPFISSRVSGILSDSMVAQAADVSARTLDSGDDSSVVSSSSSPLRGEVLSQQHRQDGGEENEPPDGGSGGAGRQQGRSGGMEGSSSGARAGASRNWSGSPGGRRVLLSGAGGGGAGGGDQNQGPPLPTPPGGANDQLTLILLRLQQDMTSVLDRLNRLEAQTRQAQKETQETRRTSNNSSWWPFASQTGRAAFFVLVWPVIVHLLLSYLFRRRRRRT